MTDRVIDSGNSEDQRTLIAGKSDFEVIRDLMTWYRVEQMRNTGVGTSGEFRRIEAAIHEAAK